jgi:hypothetical protein
MTKTDVYERAFFAALSGTAVAGILTTAAGTRAHQVAIAAAEAFSPPYEAPKVAPAQAARTRKAQDE